MSVSYKIRTTRQNLNIYNDNLRAGGSNPPSDLVVFEKRATHVVTSVTWGADCISSFETAFSNQTERDLTKFHLHTILDFGVWSADIELKTHSESFMNELARRTSVRIYGDVVPLPESEMPTEPLEALAFMKQLHTHVRDGGRHWTRALGLLL